LFLTKELGRLAKWLMILGFDTEYFKRDNVISLIIQALKDGRIIVARNHRLPRPFGVKILLIKAETLKEQILEVLKGLKITAYSDMMFTRCAICNEELAPADKETIKDRALEYVLKTQEAFYACPKCKRIYWRGTRWGNVSKILKEIWSS
jgi:uncharacterized protein